MLPNNMPAPHFVVTDEQKMIDEELADAINEYSVSVRRDPDAEVETGNCVTSARVRFSNSVVFSPTAPNKGEVMINKLKNSIG